MASRDENSSKLPASDVLTRVSGRAIPAGFSGIAYAALAPSLRAEGGMVLFIDALDDALRDYRSFSVLAADPQSYVHVGAVPTRRADELPDELEGAQHELYDLRVQNEILKSRVAEERRAAARETRRYDQLEAHHHELITRYDELIDRINERSKANDVLQRALIAQRDGHLTMFEAYEGVVKHVGKKTAVVLFEMDDDLVEHTYQSEQFIDGRLPKKGDRLAVFVLGAELPVEDGRDAKVTGTTEGTDEHATRPGRHVSGPLEL